jgi:uncharacterized protein
MRPIDQLLPLQRLDTTLDGIERRLNEIRAELLDRSTIQEIEARQAEADTTLSSFEADQRDIDLEAEQLRTKLKNEETKLYSGKGGNPKELSALTQEVEQTKRLLSQCEDRVMALIAQADTARAERTAITSTLDQLNEERAAREVELKNEARGLLRQQIQLKKDIESARAEIDPMHLRQYDRLRTSKGGLAVVEIRQRICQGCRVSLTTRDEHRLRGDELVTCASCGRILSGNV